MRHKTKALALAMTAALAAGSVLAACTAGDDDLVAVVHVSAASPLASSAQKGVDRLRAEGHRTSRVTPDSGDEVEAMADAAGDGAVIVVGPGSAHPALMAALNEVAAEFPDERFLLYDGHVVANNITSITFRRNEAGFTAGVLAGLVTTRAD
ncbi:MAG: BMP family ABC transporter substrate-binding protein, partial [Propionibacteriaceae bacterium]|nr:BMP family ABC transporter substrate-binding protein [Propionibacteriaceae bacterium]